MIVILRCLSPITIFLRQEYLHSIRLIWKAKNGLKMKIKKN